MKRRLLGGTRWWRVGVLSLSIALAIVLPANAGPRSATATITDDGACSFTVSYTWSGFSGKGLVAEVALGYREAGGLNVVFATADFPDQGGSGGPVSATFTLTGTPSATPHRYFGRGNLFTLARKNEPWTLSGVRGSVVYSEDTEARACGSTVTVS